MTAKALQRVVVRMLYDPALVEAVYVDAATALVGVDVTDVERAWLVAPDRRRWRADPLRRARGLQALLEEYPVSGAVTVRREGVVALDAFFSTPAFHRCIQDRRSLALAFGEWLAGRGDPLLRGVSDIESAIAAVRRPQGRRQPWGPSHSHALSPRVAVRVLPGGTMAAFGAIRAALVQSPRDLLAAVVDLDLELELGRHCVAPDAPEGLIVEGADEVALGDGPLGLVRVLMAARAPVSADTLATVFVEHGAEPGEVEALIADLERDGLLISTPV